MSARVVYGPFHPELEEAFLDELVSRKKRSPLEPVAVVTPSRRMADRLQRAVASRVDGALLNVVFHTFFSLAREIVSASGSPERPLFGDPAFYDRVVDGLLDGGGFDLFSEGVRAKGLSPAVRASIKDLTDAGVDPQRAMERVDEGLFGSPGEPRRLKSLFALHSAYLGALSRLPMIPAHELTRLATERAESSSYLDRFQGILYYGFYDLTGLQLDFFRAVVDDRDAVVFYPYVSDHPAYAFAKPFFETNLPRRSAPRKAKPRGGGAFSEAAKRLFIPGSEPVERPEGLEVLNASGSRDEVWAAAKQVLRWVEEEGFRFDEIGVVARSLDGYQAEVAQVFGENKIPFSTSAKEPLLRNPFARLASSLLSLRRREFPALQVRDLLASPYFKAKPSDPEFRPPWTWVFLIEHLGIGRGRAQWEGKLSAVTEGGLTLESGRSVPAADSQGLLELIRALDEDLAALRHPKWKSAAEAAKGILEKWFVAPKAGAKDGKVWEKTFAEIEALGAYDWSGIRCDAPKFLDAFSDRLRAASLPYRDRDNLGVQVLDAMAARGERFRALIMIGLKEGLFPRQIREDPFLRDKVRVLIRDHDGPWISPKLAGHGEEKLLFHALVSSARERLTLVYPRSDDEGRAQVPSMYLCEFARVTGTDLREPSTNRGIPRQPVERLRRAEERFLTPQELSMREAFEETDLSAYLVAVGLDDGDFPASKGAARAIGTGGEMGPFDGRVGESDSVRGRILERGLSPTAMEAFGKCPFQFYASRILGLREQEQAGDQAEMSSSTFGTILHAALQRFHERLSSADFWKRKDRSFPEPLFQEVVSEVLSGYRAGELGLYPLVWKVLRLRFQELLRNFSVWDLGDLDEKSLVPSFFEEGLGGTLPIRLPDGLEGLSFSGRADRIDVDSHGFRVVDYKTRWKDGKIGEGMASGKLFQPLIYVELGKRLSGKARGRPAYLSVSAASAEEPVPVEFSMSVEEWEAYRAKGFSALEEHLKQIDQGDFFIVPGDHCQWCPFQTVCRKNHSQSRRRSSRGAAFEGFVRVKGGGDVA